jgi:hypothetical protein
MSESAAVLGLSLIVFGVGLGVVAAVLAVVNEREIRRLRRAAYPCAQPLDYDGAALDLPRCELPQGHDGQHEATVTRTESSGIETGRRWINW